MLWLLALILAADARSPCRELKPKQKPSPESMNLVSSVLQTAVGAAGVPLPIAPSTLVSGLGSLASDNQARDWFLYQVCTLKEAGMLSPEKAEEIVASALGGGGRATPGPAPTLSPQEAAARQGIVDAIDLWCSPRMPAGSEVICAANRQMLADFDATYGR